MTESDPRKELFSKLNQETAKISWLEMQRFFASGNALYVADDLDLIQVAADFSEDNTALLKPLIEEKKLAPVTDQQALAWTESEAMVWAVVIAPWVLVQPVKNA